MHEIGDRIYPESMGELGRLNLRMHLARYDFALSVMRIGGKTLDAGCGCGYGTRILSWLSSEVVAVDRSLHAIDYAKVNYAYPRIKYLVGDVRVVTGVDFDTVVCFEMLEHNDNTEDLLKFLMSRLKVGGKGLFSVPVSSYAHGHVRFFTKQEIKDLFKSYVGKLHFQHGTIVTHVEGDDVNIVIAELVCTGG